MRQTSDMSKKASFVDRYGRWALVTGAASGIGAAFARSLASRGVSLVLVDRDEVGVRKVAEGLRASYRVEIETRAGDLLDDAFLERVSDVATTHDLGFVVHCAGIYAMGEFTELPLEPHLRAIDLHCRVSALLAHRAANAMKRRGKGALVLISSNSALIRAPYVANYAATKAYTLTLAEALYEELRPHGIDVLGLAPGMTDTPLLAASRPDTRRIAPMLVTPEAVAEQALSALGRAPICVPSLGDRLAAIVLGGLVPSRVSRFVVARSMRYFFPHLER